MAGKPADTGLSRVDALAALAAPAITDYCQAAAQYGSDKDWKSTTHLIERAVGRFVRAGGRRTEGEAGHLIEAIAVVVFDRQTGLLDPDLPPEGSGLRWPEFVSTIHDAYQARFGEP